MAPDDPVIIEAALNGVTTKAHNPNVPITPGEQAKDALQCVEAGATVIHTHAPNVGAPPEETAEAYADALTRALAPSTPDDIGRARTMARRHDWRVVVPRIRRVYDEALAR